MTVLTEVCIETVSGARCAARAGADRIELCCGLTDGGLTPSFGLFRAVRRAVEIPIMVLIRPRAGDFVYDADELALLQEDIRFLRGEGADGVVLGCLRPDGDLDVDATSRLVDAASPLSVTFHRAFDMTRDPARVLDRLAALGIDRILTSGQAASVAEGTTLLRELVTQAGDRIVVMPGGGVREENARSVIDATGAREIHFSASSIEDGPVTHRGSRSIMGTGRPLGEFERRITGEDAVRRIIAAANS